MSRRVLVGFIFVNVIVSFAVAIVLISYDRSRRPNEPAEGPTQIVILTATPLPGLALEAAEYQSTIDTQFLTMTALAQSAPVVIYVTVPPDEGEAGIPVPEVTAVATIDPALLPAIPTDLPAWPAQLDSGERRLSPPHCRVGGYNYRYRAAVRRFRRGYSAGKRSR